MKIKKTVTREIVYDALCDFCQASVDDKSGWPEPNDVHDSQDIRIQHYAQSHDSYESLGSKFLEIDCCPACWTNKVLPALWTLGLTREYVET